MRALAITALLAVAVVVGACGDSEAPEPTTISVEAPTAATTGSGPATTTTLDESAAAVPPDDSAGDPEAADDPGADRPRSVEDVVAAVLTGSETARTICDSLVTPRYVQTAYGDRAGCVAAQRPGSLADSVELGEIDEVSGSAIAIAIPAGGPYDGVEVEVGLVAATDLEDAWVVDSLVADVPAGP